MPRTDAAVSPSLANALESLRARGLGLRRGSEPEPLEASRPAVPSGHAALDAALRDRRLAARRARAARRALRRRGDDAGADLGGGGTGCRWTGGLARPRWHLRPGRRRVRRRRPGVASRRTPARSCRGDRACRLARPLEPDRHARPRSRGAGRAGSACGGSARLGAGARGSDLGAGRRAGGPRRGRGGGRGAGGAAPIRLAGGRARSRRAARPCRHRAPSLGAGGWLCRARPVVRRGPAHRSAAGNGRRAAAGRVGRGAPRPSGGGLEGIDPWRYDWDGTAAGWPSAELPRERIRMGPPRVA